jgi:hypothetical protein
MLPPSSGSENKASKRPVLKQVASRAAEPPAFALVSCLAYTSTLNMEAKFSSKTSVYFERTSLHYIPEDSTHISAMVVLQLAVVER